MLRNFPAKILLFGEYTILNGSKALALPYGDLEGRWSFSNDDSSEAQTSRQSLRSFSTHDCAHIIDLERLRSDLDQGLWFHSSIPQGYGLGSSGALIAAIYDSYGRHDRDRKISLARLEDFFHGSSSGIDPLVSLVQKPLLIHSMDEVEELRGPLKTDGFFLIDSGKARQTGPLVSIFKQKLNDPQFKRSCREVLAREVNFAIDEIVQNKPEHLFHHLWLISKFQWDYFPEMIPTQMRGIWSRGLETGDYILKLCGAGGGGFFIGFSDKLGPSEKLELFKSFELREL
jgi:mevalonate kinase